MKKILITFPIEEKEKVEFYRAAENGKDDFELHFIDEEKLSEEEVKDAAVIIGMVSPYMIRSCEKLEWLQIGWAGAEQYCKDGILQQEVILTNASGAYGNTVSEHMVALTMALAASLKVYIGQQEKRLWKLQKRTGVMSGSTVLVFGTGDIGTRYASVMRSMGCYVIGISRTKKKACEFFDEQYISEEAGSVIGRADVIALVLPGGEHTRHMIGRDMIRKMKHGVLLVNAGRGSTVDTEALIEGIRKGIIGGAGLDVFEDEPLGESPLWGMENVIITPHAAGKLEDRFNREKVKELCLNNLYRYAHGMELQHIVDKKFAY